MRNERRSNKLIKFVSDSANECNGICKSLQLDWCITFAYCFVIVFGALGNMLTVLAVIRNPQMRTTRNFFIVNLALSDFFICTVTAPITLYTVRSAWRKLSWVTTLNIIINVERFLFAICGNNFSSINLPDIDIWHWIRKLEVASRLSNSPFSVFSVSSVAS